MLKLTCAAAALAVAAVAAGGGVSAADYPEKRIEWLVGFSAGGGTDLVSRRIAQGMEERLGEDLTIVNKPGAGGLVALQEAAAAPADGYTLATFVTNNMLIQKHCVGSSAESGTTISVFTCTMVTSMPGRTPMISL